MKKIISIILMASLLALTVVGCSGDSGTTGSRKVNFADASWDSNKLHNAIAGLVAEELWDYETIITPGSTTVLHEGLLKGEVDVHMEVWTDNLATYNDDLAQGKLKELSTNFDDNNQGVYVPRYVIEGDAERGIEASAPDLKTIQQLKDYPDVFKDEENPGMGRMYGAIPGWEVDEILYKKFMYLGMDETFIYFRPGSDAALSAAITSAYEKGEPIASYYWEPTWLLGIYDMVLLEDEPFDPETYMEGISAMPSVKVTIGISNKFADNEDNKEFVDFLSKYETSSALTSEGLGYMNETDADYDETARWFLKEHPELVDAWLTPEDAETMKTILNQ